MQSLGIVEENENTAKAIPYDKEQAVKLYDALKSCNLINRGRAPSMSKWANEFRMLRKYAKEQEISAVLEWYTNHLNDKFIPKCYSAMKFRLSFDRIVHAMNKAGHHTKPIMITPEAKRIIKELDLTWAGINTTTLWTFAQLCLNNYEAFENRLRKLVKRLESKAAAAEEKSGLSRTVDTKDARMLRWLWDNLPNRSSYVEHWITKVHDTSVTWEGWQGNILQWALTEDHRRFQMMLANIVADYTTDPAKWPRVQELLKNG